YRNPEDPAPVIYNMLYYSLAQAGLKDHRKEYSDQFALRGKGKFNFKPGFISQEEVIDITTHYGLPIIKNILIKPNELNDIKNDAFPLVLKGINHEVIHKSELDAVKLNIKTKDELKSKAQEIVDNFNKY